MNIEVINFKTGELIKLDAKNLKSLMDTYEAAKAKKDEVFTVMETIKMLLIEKTKTSREVDPTRLTRRVEGNGVTAILKENPKINWDEAALKQAKRTLGSKSFERFFKIKTEFKPQYRELNKLPHTVASSKTEGKAYKLILDARRPTGESSFYLSWEKAKDGEK